MKSTGKDIENVKNASSIFCRKDTKGNTIKKK